MSDHLLKVEALSAAYGGIRAINGVSIEVGRQEIVSVLGSNGAGKTTLLKCISAVMKPTGGSVAFLGKPLPHRPHDVVKAGLAHAPEGRQILSNLTVYENLMVGAYLRKDSAGIRADLDYVYALFPRLKEREKQYGGYLSGGEQQMLAISRAIMARPLMIMLDEPSLGLAPIIVNRIFEIITELKKHGISILLVEQNAYKALSVSDSAYIMSVGRVVEQGAARDLLSNQSLTEAYLGG
jgi:branched-chain amino acid transport system ATP-binding protein